MHRRVAPAATSNIMAKSESQDLQVRAAASGTTIKEFLRSEGVNHSTYNYWGLSGVALCFRGLSGVRFGFDFADVDGYLAVKAGVYGKAAAFGSCCQEAAAYHGVGVMLHGDNYLCF